MTRPPIPRAAASFVALGLRAAASSCVGRPALDPPEHAPSGEPPQPPPASPAAVKSVVPDPPWSLSYHDGSGNGFELEQASADDEVRFSYSPVEPARSSSGSYDGGSPAAGTLPSDRVVEVWRGVRRLETDTSLHATSRMMGTGAFRLVTPSGERSFIVQRGDELSAFEAVLAPLRNR